MRGRTLVPWIPPSPVRAFRAAVDATPGLTQALVPTGAGLLVVVRDDGLASSTGTPAQVP
ncbi:hypothetical protein V6N00_10405 [Tersicoccus sp. MR15.9]|uniref:hypothetical protein n=1 Tax=Tersicoccus mangrovi TaxID=3121635 RepID=UPI002FE57ACA